VLIAGNACGLRVEDWFVVHEELISVMAVRELHFDKPTSVHAAAHGVRSWIPPVEIAHQINRTCGRSGTIEIDRLGRFSCRIQIGGSLLEHGIYYGKAVNALRGHFNAEADCRSLFVIVRRPLRTPASDFLRETQIEAPERDDRRNACPRA
jgi:hypothetical protein